jgi:hypothetical protein
VDYSACDLMYHVLITMKSGATEAEVSSVIDSVLVTSPYQIGCYVIPDSSVRHALAIGTTRR